MLKNQNDEQLKQRGINEKVIPFYQVWKELVNAKTLDIYQYRILTSLSALEELAEVLEKTIKGVFTNDANVEACREETIYILNADLIIEKYYKAIGNRLKFALGSKPKADAEKTRLLAQVKYAINKMVPTYEENAVEELKNSIIAGNMKEIAFYANIVASQSAHNGWSTQALNDLLRFFMEEKKFDEQWELFKNTILNREKKSHDVLIHIPFRNQSYGDNSDTLGILKNLGMDICTYEKLTRDYSSICDITSLLKAEKKYFRVNVLAFDIYSAAHIAIRELSDILNMASFYNLVSAWDLSSVSIVVINDVTLREKLTGAFGYANISRASLFQEEKYMNLWVALESLARTRMYSDIITNVKKTVPAAMSLRYIYRIVRNYVEDCIRCRVVFDFPEHCIDMKQETKQKLVKETIEVFRDSELYDLLLQKCKVNSLLRYRTERVYEILNDSKMLKTKVKNHHDRIEWQIQRLYRIRNEIVHSALQNETSLITYIEHLYDYLSIYITEIVTCMSEGKEGTLEETLAVIKDNYDVFIALIEQNDQLLIEEKVVKTGVINLI